MVEIVTIETQEDLFKCRWMFEKVPLVQGSWQTLFAQCLLGQHTVWASMEDSGYTGVLVYNGAAPNAYVSGLYGPKLGQYLFDAIYDRFRSLGYKHLRASSVLPQETFESITGFKKLYSIYGRTL